jgi:mRNA interferase MazF
LIFRGEVYDVDLGRPVGHEPGFERPVVIVSDDVINNGPGEMVAVVPIGSTHHHLRSHIELEPGQNGLVQVSYARCDQIRFVSTERLRDQRGMLTLEEMSAVDHALRFVLGL